MTAADFAALLDARPVGTGKWMGKCPAHRDRSPSLSIGEGRDSRVLVNCLAGCGVTAILKALGLQLKDLFSATPVTPEQRVVAEKAHRIEDARTEAQRRAERNAFDTERLASNLFRLVSEALALLPDGDPREQEMTALYHQIIDLFRRCEAESERVLRDRQSYANTNGPRCEREPLMRMTVPYA